MDKPNVTQKLLFENRIKRLKTAFIRDKPFHACVYIETDARTVVRT